MRDPMLVLNIGSLPPGLNSSGGGKRKTKGLLNMHFSEYSEMKKQWALIVQNAVANAVPDGWQGFGIGPVWMMVVRFSTGSMDRDNLWSSMKPVMDGLVRAGVFFDDNEIVLPWPRIVQIKVTNQQQCGIVIAIRKMRDEEKNEILAMRTWARSIGTPTAGMISGMLQDD